MEFGKISIHLPNYKNTRRHIMSNIKNTPTGSNINTYANSNNSIQKLSDQDLANCSGGSLPNGGAPTGNEAPTGNVFGGTPFVQVDQNPPLNFSPEEQALVANLRKLAVRGAKHK
jgi:hypothetical protein